MPLDLADAPQQALGFLVSQVSHIETQVWETKYPDITYQDLIPVDTSAGEWVKSVTYYSTDKAGAARWINGQARDIPMVSTNREKHETAVEMAGIGYDYSLEEINQARSLGINLSADEAMAARRAYEEYVESVAFSGDTEKGFEGLINNSNVTAANVANDGTGSATAWTTKTPDLIMRDINAGITGIWTASKTVELADTILLPLAQYAYLTNTRIADTSMTIFEWIQRNNVYTAQTGQPIRIRAMRQLDGAGASSTDRMITYRNDPSVLKLHIPMPLMFMPPQQVVMQFLVPGIFRLGGTDIRRPGSVRYSDGI